MVFIIDDVLIWIAEKVHEAAKAELMDESKLQEELILLETSLELGEITEEEYKDLEKSLMERLNSIRKMKEEE